jgi:pimeloyl-ACP methyl ester carboxylesterase
MTCRRVFPALGLALVSLAAGGCSPLEMEAARVLADLGAGPGPSTLKETTPPPERRLVSYRVDGRVHRGDLYRPGEEALAAMVLVPGAAPAGKDDPRLVAFANTLARARFAVLVPDMPGVRGLRLRASDAREVGDAVLHLSSLAVGRDGVGIAGISYAAGPAIIAALDPAVGSRVRFIVAIGGYYDVEAALTFFTTGYYRERPGGSWLYRIPSAYGKWVFVQSNVDLVADPTDRALLGEMARRKLENLEADIGDLVGRLGPEGSSVYTLLLNDDPERAPALMAALPAAVRENLVGLDLKRRDLSRLKARLILVHGRDDVIIPFSESVALAAAVPEGQADLYLVDNLFHVDLGAMDLGDELTLWRAVHRVLELRGEVA